MGENNTPFLFGALVVSLGPPRPPISMLLRRCRGRCKKECLFYSTRPHQRTGNIEIRGAGGHGRTKVNIFKRSVIFPRTGMDFAFELFLKFVVSAATVCSGTSGCSGSASAGGRA